MATIIWLVIFVVLLGIEIATLGLTTIWFAGGALVAVLAAALGLPVYVQIPIFLIVSTVLLLFTRPFALKRFNKERIKTNAESLVGETAVVTEKINNLKGMGKAVVNGQEWTARSSEVAIELEEETKVTIYSNQPEVELLANGISLGKQTSDVHFFYFQVPNDGETKLTAVAGSCQDESIIRKVAKPNPAYRLVEQGAILNWWDITEPEGYCSLNTRVKDIVNSIGMEGYIELMEPYIGRFEPVYVNMFNSMSVLRKVNLLIGMQHQEMSKETLLGLNDKLNAIPQPPK